MCFQPDEMHLIKLTYGIFIASVYLARQDILKVTNRDVHQVE